MSPTQNSLKTVNEILREPGSLISSKPDGKSWGVMTSRERKNDEYSKVRGVLFTFPQIEIYLVDLHLGFWPLRSYTQLV